MDCGKDATVTHHVVWFDGKEVEHHECPAHFAACKASLFEVDAAGNYRYLREWSHAAPDPE